MGSRQKVKEIVVIWGPKCGRSFGGTERDDEESQGPMDHVSVGRSGDGAHAKKINGDAVQDRVESKGC